MHLFPTLALNAPVGGVPIGIPHKTRIMGLELGSESTFKLRSIEKFRHVVISHDMTKDEREQCKRLVEETKERESEEPSGEYIFRVRGPPGDIKVVKLRKRM